MTARFAYVADLTTDARLLVKVRRELPGYVLTRLGWANKRTGRGTDPRYVVLAQTRANRWPL